MKELLNCQEQAHKTELDVGVQQTSERMKKLESTATNLTTSSNSMSSEALPGTRRNKSKVLKLRWAKSLRKWINLTPKDKRPKRIFQENYNRRNNVNAVACGGVRQR